MPVHFLEIRKPEDTKKIWRYMDFARFIIMLRHKLRFLRTDQFKDELDTSMESYLRQIHRTPTESKPISPKVLQGTKKVDNLWRKVTYANCWHISNDESALLWDKYSQYRQALVIQSTFGSLKKALQNAPQIIKIGAIVYDTHELTPQETQQLHISHVNIPFQAFIKQPYCKDEQELRAVIHDAKNKGKTHIDIEVDLNVFVDKIILAYNTPDWLLELVKNICKEYEIKAKPEKSNVYQSSILEHKRT